MYAVHDSIPLQKGECCALFVQSGLNPTDEDATLTWGAVAAGQLSAEYQLLAWTGAQNVPMVGRPLIPILFSQLIAGDNSTAGAYVGSWSPQVSLPAVSTVHMMRA